MRRIRQTIDEQAHGCFDDEVNVIARLELLEAQFPAGTPVCVRHTVRRRGQDYTAEVVGVVEAWEQLPTGSWYAHGKRDKLWLSRLKLRKVDGEITWLVMDDSSEIAKLEPAKAK
jgi:hypothetical protein